MQEHATIKKLAMDVELVLDVERAVPFSILRRYNKQIEIIAKRKREIWNFLNVQELASNLGIIESIDNINNDEQGVSTDQAIESLRQNIKILTKEMKYLVDQTRDNKKLLNAIVEQNKIYMDEN